MRLTKLCPFDQYLIKTTLILVIFIHSGQISVLTTFAQSIGFQPQFNFGFNPYLSPVYGYGLGLPFGTYNFSPSKYPWLLNSISGASFDGNGFIGKIHAKTFLKKLAASQFSLYPQYGSIKDKLNLMKHPEYAFTPYGASYGYGKHYGAALVPNNPYKSVYADYYDGGSPTVNNKPEPVSSKHNINEPIGGYSQSTNLISKHKPHTNYKPLIKAGALLTTAAILGKKALESPIRLNPSGMILSGVQP